MMEADLVEDMADEYHWAPYNLLSVLNVDKDLGQSWGGCACVCVSVYRYEWWVQFIQGDFWGVIHFSSHCLPLPAWMHHLCCTHKQSQPLITLYSILQSIVDRIYKRLKYLPFWTENDFCWLSLRSSSLPACWKLQMSYEREISTFISIWTDLIIGWFYKVLHDLPECVLGVTLPCTLLYFMLHITTAASSIADVLQRHPLCLLTDSLSDWGRSVLQSQEYKYLSVWYLQRC